MSATDKIQNIGILGGTFDPVHKGHLCVADQLISRFELDLVLFIPAALPPHKQLPLASYSHRVAMLEAALFGEELMSVSLIESEFSGPSYTIDTLLELKQRLGPQNFYLIIGADAFCELHLWHKFIAVLKEIHIIVASRPGYTLKNFLQGLSKMPGKYIKNTKNTSVEKWSCITGKSISYYQETHESVSSTAIRKLLQHNKPADIFLPQQVLQYIYRHKLYTTCIRSIKNCDM